MSIKINGIEIEMICENGNLKLVGSNGHYKQTLFMILNGVHMSIIENSFFVELNEKDEIEESKADDEYDND